MSSDVVPVPKSIARVKETFAADLTMEQLVFGVVNFIISLAIMSYAIKSQYAIVQSFLLLVVVVQWGCILVFLRTPEQLEDAWWLVRFYYRYITGDTTVLSLRKSVAYLKKLVGVEEVHPGGIIRFRGLKWGYLIRVTSKRVSEEELENHLAQSAAFLKSLHGNVMIKAIATIKVRAVNPLEKSLVVALNQKGKTKQQKEHLYNLYESVKKRDVPASELEGLIFFGLGRHVSYEKALVQSDAFLEGFLMSLHNIGVHTRLLITENEIIEAYASNLTSKVV